MRPLDQRIGEGVCFGSKERREAVGKSLVSAVLVTKIVTRTVMQLWAISGGGGGGQEAGAIETANSMWTKEGRSIRL